MTEPPILPAHVEETVHAIAKLHVDHYKSGTVLEHAVARMTQLIGRPGTVSILTLALVGWIGANLLGYRLGYHVFDPPPFNWLQGVVSILALYITVLILTTQRRDDRLAAQREQLTLQLAFFNERKSAKIIRLLEEMRSDDANLRKRADPEAAAMSVPADPRAVMDALEETHAGLMATEDEESDDASEARSGRASTLLEDEKPGQTASPDRA